MHKQDIYLNQEQLNKLPFLGMGKDAIVLQKNSHCALKIYHKAKKVHKNSIGENEGLDNFGVVLPKKDVYVDDVLKGYSMPFISGFNLKELAIYAPITCKPIFQRAYQKALKDIHQISSRGIVMDDLLEDNIMFDENRKTFKFIDIDQWDYSHNYFTVWICTEEDAYSTLVTKKQLFKENDSSFFFDMNGNLYNYRVIQSYKPLQDKKQVEKINQLKFFEATQRIKSSLR